MTREYKRFYFFIGTVAEFGKLTPVFHELENRKIDYKIIESGQNNINYRDFRGYVQKNKSDVLIYKKKDKSSILIFSFWAITALTLGIIKLKKEFKGLNKSNSYFIVHGDTVTSVIGSLIAKFYNLKLVHIEAGYRSGNLLEPFPEEFCTRINDYLADIMFAPTNWALKNLKKYSGVKISTIHNTNIDSFWNIFRKKLSSNLLRYKKFYILIMHRQEHVLFKKDWSKKVMELVIKNAPTDLTCLLQNHPLTVQIIKGMKLKEVEDKVKLIPFLPYSDFLKLVEKSEFVATDSATLQQEAFYMGKPLLALKDFSVQSEGIGTNTVLSGSNEKVIKSFLKNYKQYSQTYIKPKKSPAKIIVDYLAGNIQ